MLKIDSLLSIGLYKLDLWELKTATLLFQKVIALAANTDHQRWAEKASVCLALVNSYLALREESYILDLMKHETSAKARAQILFTVPS